MSTNVLAAPRAVLSVLAALYAVTAVATTRYPPSYLPLAHVWAALAAVAAATCLASAIVPGRRLVSVAGAAAITAAAARAVAVGVQLGIGDIDGPQAWSFLLACLSWATIAVMVHSLWENLVLPWTALMRE